MAPVKPCAWHPCSNHTCLVPTVLDAGWVSGTVTLPAQCAPPQGQDAMTAFECDACLTSSAPKGCLACSKALFKDSCGFLRQSYWVRKRPSFIKWTRRETCPACICHKPRDVAARNRWVHYGVGYEQV
jgi:hypothetical protein